MKHPITIYYNKTCNKYNIISQYLASAAGRARLAASMIAPLRTTLDYQSIGRKTFLVEQLPTGALPIYDREPIKRFDNKIINIGGNSKPYNTRTHALGIFGKRVTVPQFTIFSNPTISVAEIKSRRFNIIDRHVQKARQELMSQDDSMIFSTLDQVAESEIIPEPAKKVGESKMNTEKVAKGIKIFGAILVAVCLAGGIYSFVHPVTSGPTLDQQNEVNHK